MPTGLDVQRVLEGGYSFTRHEISHLHANTLDSASHVSPPAVEPPVIKFGSFESSPINQRLVRSAPDILGLESIFERSSLSSSSSGSSRAASFGTLHESCSNMSEPHKEASPSLVCLVERGGDKKVYRLRFLR